MRDANGVVSQKEKLQNSLIFALIWPGMVNLRDPYPMIFFLRNKPDFILRGWFFLGGEPICCDPEEYELIENQTDYKRQIESLADLMHAQGSSFFAWGFKPICKKGSMRLKPGDEFWPTFPKDILLKMGFSEQHYLDAAAGDKEGKIPKSLPFMTLPAVLSPVTQNWWLYKLKYVIDRGSDGFHWDVVQETLCDVTSDYVREYFKEFLRNNFTQDELKEKLAIDDIDKFDYRRCLQYLKENNIQRKLDKLDYFYLLARLKGNKEALQKVYDEARQYARDKYGRDFIITGNHHMLTLDHLAASDMLMAWEPFNCMPSGSEKLTRWDNPIMPGQTPTRGSRIAENKWWNNIYPGKRAVIFPDHGWWPDWKAYLPEEKPDWSMDKMTAESKIEYVNWYCAESYANGNGFVFGPWMDFDGSVDKMMDFLRSHKNLLLDYEPNAQVGLIFSYSSFLAGKDRVIEPYQELEYKKTGHYLATKNIQWAMVPLFDGFVEKDLFNIEDINKYDLLILSSVVVMTQNQRDVIQQFIDEGKQVITIGDEPALDVKLNPLERLEISEVNHLFSLEELGERISEVISRKCKSNLSEENIKVIINKDSNSVVMHMINYDFDEESLKFSKKKSVKLSFESSENFKPYVKIFSLGRGDEMTILRKTGDLYEMVIPELYIWTIIKLERC